MKYPLFLSMSCCSSLRLTLQLRNSGPGSIQIVLPLTVLSAGDDTTPSPLSHLYSVTLQIHRGYSPSAIAAGKV